MKFQLSIEDLTFNWNFNFQLSIQVSTFNFQLSTFNFQLSIQFSTFNFQLSRTVQVDGDGVYVYTVYAEQSEDEGVSVYTVYAGQSEGEGVYLEGGCNIRKVEWVVEWRSWTFKLDTSVIPTVVVIPRGCNWKFDWKLKVESWIESWKLKVESWKLKVELKVESWKLKVELKVESWIESWKLKFQLKVEVSIESLNFNWIQLSSWTLLHMLIVSSSYDT